MKKVETKFGTYIDMETKSNTEITGDKIKVFVERLKKLVLKLHLRVTILGFILMKSVVSK